MVYITMKLKKCGADSICQQCGKTIRKGSECWEITYRYEDPFLMWVHSRCLKKWEKENEFKEE